MELVRVVSHNTHKRMVSCLQGHIGAEAEKRHVRHYLSVAGCVTTSFVFCHLTQADFSSPPVHDLSFVFFYPPTTQNTTVRPTPLYRKWSGKNTRCVSHSDICPLSRSA